MGLIAEADAGEPPGAGGGIGFELAAGEDGATELRTGDDIRGNEVEAFALSGVRDVFEGCRTKAR